jgi:hypothetical protein
MAPEHEIENYTYPYKLLQTDTYYLRHTNTHQKTNSYYHFFYSSLYSKIQSKIGFGLLYIMPCNSFKNAGATVGQPRLWQMAKDILHVQVHS